MAFDRRVESQWMQVGVAAGAARLNLVGGALFGGTGKLLKCWTCMFSSH